MALSTEETVRQALVEAIEAIAVSGLGFDQAGGNVKEYPLDLEAKEDVPDYLTALVGGEPVVRCWSVFVTASEDWLAEDGVGIRRYTVKFEAYYEVETAGAGANLIVEHARKVRGAIRSLGSMLGGRVDTMAPISEVQISRLSGVEPSDGQILVATFGFTAERRNPDF